jgi:hypothetical protein
MMQKVLLSRSVRYTSHKEKHGDLCFYQAGGFVATQPQCFEKVLQHTWVMHVLNDRGIRIFRSIKIYSKILESSYHFKVIDTFVVDFYETPFGLSNRI